MLHNDHWVLFIVRRGPSSNTLQLFGTNSLQNKNIKRYKLVAELITKWTGEKKLKKGQNVSMIPVRHTVPLDTMIGEMCMVRFHDSPTPSGIMGPPQHDNDSCGFRVVHALYVLVNSLENKWTVKTDLTRFHSNQNVQDMVDEMNSVITVSASTYSASTTTTTQPSNLTGPTRSMRAHRTPRAAPTGRSHPARAEAGPTPPAAGPRSRAVRPRCGCAAARRRSAPAPRSRR